MTSAQNSLPPCTEKMPSAFLVFVTPPSMEELEGRLRSRCTEPEEVIQDRLKAAGRESMLMSEYDYILINDVVEECVDRLHGIFLS